MPIVLGTRRIDVLDFELTLPKGLLLYIDERSTAGGLFAIRFC